MMLALGLEKKIVGSATLTAALPDRWQAAFKKINTMKNPPGEYPGKEAIFGTNPDFILTDYPTAFGDKYGGIGETQADLQAQGINSYLGLGECASRTTPYSIDITYTDLLNIGRIFGVEPTAQQVVEQMKRDVKMVQDKLRKVKGSKPKVFYFDGEHDAPYAAGGLGVSNALIAMAGGENIFADLPKNWQTVSWETVVNRKPDVILLWERFSDNGTNKLAEQDRQFLTTSPILANVPAIKSQRFVKVTFSDVLGPGPRNAEGVQLLAKAFYPELFK
jgi:iron complex transport system substrate-binding protein